MNMEINMIAVIVAVVANFILGFIWYTPLFGKAWAREMGFDPDQKTEGGAIAKGMVTMLIGNFLLAWVFAHNIGAWSFVPGAEEMAAFETATSAALFTWLGFYLPVDIGAVFWERKSWKLFGINTGYHLITLVLVAMILVMWPS